jgi:UDP-glucose 4-epimerase
MRIAVTGANGFVGRHVVASCAAHGDQVRAAMRTPAQVDDGIEAISAPDLAADADWSRVVADMEAVIHCAARVHVMKDNAADPLAEFRRVNRDGTLALARAAATAGVRRFVFLSSIKVNGEAASIDAPFRADDAVAPTDPYGISKAEAESGLFALGRETGMEVVVIRPVLVYGPGVRANFRAMLAAVSKGLPLPLGKLRNRRSFVYVGNLADLARCAAHRPAAAGRVLLVSDGEDLSTSDMLERLARAMGRPVRLFRVPGVAAMTAAILGRAISQRIFGSLVVDIEPTCTALGWIPPFGIDEGFADTARAFKAGR